MKAGFGCRIWQNLYNLLLKLPLGKSKSWSSWNWFRLGHTADSLLLVVEKMRAFWENKNLFLQKRNAVAWKCCLEQGSASEDRRKHLQALQRNCTFLARTWTMLSFHCVEWQRDVIICSYFFCILPLLFLQFSKTGCLYLSEAGLDPAIKIREWRVFPGREAPQRKELALIPGTVGRWIFCLSSW